MNIAFPKSSIAPIQPIGQWLDPATGLVTDRGAIQSLACSIAASLARPHSSLPLMAACGLPAALAPAALMGAWHAGWGFAPLRFDAPADVRQDMLHQLGTGLLFSDATDSMEGVVVATADHAQPFALWLDAGQSLPEAKAWLPDEGAVVLFTSGSSGQPKGVVHSRCNMLRAAGLFADHFQLGDGETLACMAPVHTASGLRSLAMPLVRNVNVAVWPRDTGGLAETIDSLARLDPHVLLCGPRFVATLAAAGRKLRPLLPALRCVASTGAPLGEQDRVDAMQALGVEVLDFYGLSETGGIVLAEPPGSPRPGHLPPPCPGVDANLVPVAEHADIFKLDISGPNLFLGYLHEPRFRRTVFATGDLVHRDAEGALRLVGRSDNAVKSDGTEWLFPERLESWFRNQPSVCDAHVQALPRPASGGTQGLYVVLQLMDGAVVPCSAEWRRRIASELGPEYSKTGWEYGQVSRTALGKIARAGTTVSEDQE